MASGKYKKLYEERQKRLGKTGSGPIDSQQNKINNYKARLEYGGVSEDEINKTLDDRNAVERLLNLQQNQGLIGDVFELLGRPQQALFGYSDAKFKGEDGLTGALEGLKGKRRTSGKDLLMQTGAFEDEKGKLNAVDALGFALDVFADPMDIAAIPVKAVDTVSDASKIANTVDNVIDSTKAVNKLDNVSDVAKATKNVRFVSPNELIGKKAKEGVSKLANIADTGIEKGLRKLDEAKGVKYINPDSKWASELGKVGSDKGALEVYKGLKNNLTTMFDTKLSSTARKSKKINDAKEMAATTYIDENFKKVKDNMEAAASILGKDLDTVDKELNLIVDVTNEIPMRSVIEGAKHGTIKYTDEIAENLRDLALDMGDDTDELLSGISKGKNGTLKLSDKWNYVLNNLDEGKLEQRVKREPFLTKKELELRNKLTAEYNEKVPWLVQSVKDFYDDGNSYISSNFNSMKGLGTKFDIRNTDGYSKHKLAEDYEKNVKNLENYGVSLADIQEQLPDPYTNTLSSRKYEMSVAEANKIKKKELLSLPGLTKEGKKFINDNINLFDDRTTSGMSEYMIQMPKLANKSQVLNDILITQGFGDLKSMSKLKKLIKDGVDVTENTKKLNKILDNTPFRLVESGKAPYGFKKLEGDSKEAVVAFLDYMGKKSNNKKFTNMAKTLKNMDDIAIDPTVLNILKFNNNNSQKSELVKFYNSMINFFKKNATASVTNQMNNITGNMTNMAMSGMNVKDIAKYSGRAYSDLRNWEEVLRKGVSDVSQLTPKEAEIYKNLLGFMENVGGIDKASILSKYGIEDLAKNINKKGVKGAYNRYVDLFANLNANEDRIFKYAVYLKAQDDPKFLSRIGIDTVDELGNVLSTQQRAGRAVSKILFDPTDLTAFEQGTMKNIIPFYTFAKKNIAFQLGNMGDNLQNYTKLMKGYNSIINSYEGNDENMQDYLKDNMYIPLPTIDKDGNYKFLRARLPFGDLNDLVNDPLNSVVNMSNPFAKAIYEGATGINTLTGREIEKFPGQKGNIDILEDIPVLNSAKFQQLVGGPTGLNTLAKQVNNIYTGIRDEGPLGALTKSTTISGNVDTDRINKSYEQIEDLQNLMKQYEQKGYEFSTITELKQANKNSTIDKANAIFRKYGID